MRERTLPIALLLAITATLCVMTCSASADTPSTKPKSTAAAHVGAPSGAVKGSASRGSHQNSAGSTSSGHRAVSGKSGATKHSTSAGRSSAGKATSGKTSAVKSGKHSASKTSSKHAPGQKAPTTDRITEIQQALAKNGALSGEPSGKWDDSSADGMRKFQAAHGLNPTGKLDALTLRQLGLGSSTAGMAAPTVSGKTSASTLPSDVAAPQ